MSSQIRTKRSSALSQAIRYYEAGTTEAEMIVNIILSRLQPVANAKLLYVYNYAGITGYLGRRVDAKGRIVFAVYKRNDYASAAGLRFKRDRIKYPRANRPIFLTAPNVWAHLEGYQDQYLRRDEYRKWKEDLERAAGLAKYRADVPIWVNLPKLPNPEGDIEFDRESANLAWQMLGNRLGRRLYVKRRRLMYRVWRFFVERWMVSATSVSPRTGTVTGWPRAVKAADGYLALKMGVNRRAIERAIDDLDRLGYIQAVYYLDSGLRNKRGIYYYYPGSGVPPEQPTRCPEVTPRQVLHLMRQTRWDREREKREAEERDFEYKGILEQLRLAEVARTEQEQADREADERERQERPLSYLEMVDFEVKRRREDQGQEDI